ncbi:MAG: Lrp/AsnC family transcriptional regulator [Rhodospirillales bacterium]|jgi:Lrp/AsnC family leucine-responsive transcriptional regulator
MPPDRALDRPIDRIDARILRLVQSGERRTVSELASAVGLSPSACHRRLRALEADGTIAGWAARLDPAALGYRIEAFVEIGLAAQSNEALSAFEAAVAATPEILECHLMSGHADYLIRVAAADPADYERIHRERLSRLPGVSRMVSSFCLRTIRPWRGYVVPEGR